MARFLSKRDTMVSGVFYDRNTVHDFDTNPNTDDWTAFAGDVEERVNVAGHLDRDATLYFDHPGWCDDRFPATAINPPGAASDPDVDANDGLLLFDKASTELIYLLEQMPHEWELGSTIYPHIHIQHMDTGAGDSVWRLSHDIASINGDFAGSFTDLTDLVVAAPESAVKHTIALWPGFDMSSYGLSACIKWKLARIGGDGADDYDDDVKLIEFDVHYKIDSLGSGQRGAK